MAGSDLGQVNVRLETDFLELGHSIGRQRIVKVFGHRVGVGGQSLADHWRHAQPQTSHAIARAMDQLGGELAFFDLLGDVLGILRLEDIVEIGQQRSQRQSHVLTSRGAWIVRRHLAAKSADTARLSLAPNSGLAGANPYKVARFFLRPEAMAQPGSRICRGMHRAGQSRGHTQQTARRPSFGPPASPKGGFGWHTEERPPRKVRPPGPRWSADQCRRRKPSSGRF